MFKHDNNWQLTMLHATKVGLRVPTTVCNAVISFLYHTAMAIACRRPHDTKRRDTQAYIRIFVQMIVHFISKVPPLIANQ